jgi:hypothetical protein
MDVGFTVLPLSLDAAFEVHPMSGTLTATNDASITVTYHPIKYVTSMMCPLPATVP